MLSTLSGSVIEMMPLPKKALFPMLVTGPEKRINPKSSYSFDINDTPNTPVI
jgi:hypothetical protein